MGYAFQSDGLIWPSVSDGQTSGCALCAHFVFGPSDDIWSSLNIGMTWLDWGKHHWYLIIHIYIGTKRRDKISVVRLIGEVPWDLGVLGVKVLCALPSSKPLTTPLLGTSPPWDWCCAGSSSADGFKFQFGPWASINLCQRVYCTRLNIAQGCCDETSISNKLGIRMGSLSSLLGWFYLLFFFFCSCYWWESRPYWCVMDCWDGKRYILTASSYYTVLPHILCRFEIEES